MTVKSHQKTLHRQIGCQFQGKRQIPHAATNQDKRNGSDTTCELRAKEAPEHIKENWPGSAWIVEVITSTLTSKGTRTNRCLYFITTLHIKPQAMLRLIRLRWSIENELHWARDVQLGEDAHRYSERNGVQVLGLLRNLALNLLRTNGFRSIREGRIAVSHDIQSTTRLYRGLRGAGGMIRLSVGPGMATLWL
ncbi:MAG: ISAs1 family transposase [Cyanobium sp. CZS 48M]|nr:ISAs1 family transposase [Cyanobium sp. CZS48M]